MYHEQQVTCPYCNESFTAFIDLSQGNQRTIEDCFVCCRPIELLIETNGTDLTRIEAFTDNETIF